MAGRRRASHPVARHRPPPWRGPQGPRRPAASASFPVTGPSTSASGFGRARPARRPDFVTAVAELRVRIVAGISKAKIAREFGISRQTLYQYLQEGDGAS